MTRKLSTHLLDNGLTLEFWDHSRVTAGDRWLAVLEMRLAIPLTPEALPEALRPRAAEVVRALGLEAVFTRREERHFIPAHELAETLKEMESRLLATSRPYLGHPDFAPRFIARKWQEHQEKRQWN
ncbi:MAG: hypothetical protein FJ128_05780 [Deltaproteobacteria bacterium]|nr:hypothetical protein [Deltaproteobacteria bacterium]